MGPGELFEYHRQNLFEDWAFRREWEDFSEEDLIAFCKQDPFLERLYEEFNSWRELQA
jgi:hypothetical protein